MQVTMAVEQTQRFLVFYRGKGPDSEGRLIEEIWHWDYDLLETTHDYIQWLFPLAEQSGFNPHAPILDNQTIAIIRNSAEIQGQIEVSLRVMLAFFGLQMLRGDSLAIGKSEDYSDRRRTWNKPNNHNHLRLSRILMSLRLLGLEGHAKALFKCLEGIYQEEPGSIEGRSFQHWKSAAGPPTYWQGAPGEH